MPKSNITLNSGIGSLGKISFESENISAIGGPDFPRLLITTELRFSALKSHSGSQHQPQLHPLTWLFISGRLCSSPQHKTIAEFHQTLNVFADEKGSPETQCQLEIPLDLLTVERMEQARQGELRAALQFEGLFAIHLPAANGPVFRFEKPTIDNAPFTVSKSKWVEQLLPELGYGRLELIEVRVSNGMPSSGIPAAVEEIRQARKYFTESDWEKSVVHCRKALETILQSKPLQIPDASRFSQKVDTFIETYLPLDREKSALLADEMKRLWEVSSKSAHPNEVDYFKRADAQFIVRNTTAILEYVSRLLT